MKERVIGLFVALFIVIICVAACVATGDSDDGSAWNCVLAIVALLAWLKGGK